MSRFADKCGQCKGSAEQLAFDHFAELNSVYTSKDGTERLYIRATELLNDCSKAEARCSIIIARFADGSVEAAFDRGSNAGQRARRFRSIITPCPRGHIYAGRNH